VIPGALVLSVGRADMPTPKGWCWTKLTDIARLETGHTPSRRHPEYWDGGIHWIGIKDARENHGQVIQETIQKISQLGLENSAARLLPPETVCLSRTASVGYALVTGREMATSQDFVNWVCSSALAPHYLMYALIAEKESLFRFGKGTTHTTIYFPEVKALHLCVPPIQEQRRIVAKIEELFSDLDAGMAALKRVRANLKRYRASVLKAAVEGRLTLSPTVPRIAHFDTAHWRPFSDVVCSLEQGWSPKCQREQSDDPNEWVVMKTTAIQPLRFLENENKVLPSPLRPRPELELEAGDLLITRAGPRNRTGVTCLVRQTRPKMILCDKAYRIRIDASIAESGFIEVVLNSPQILDALDELKTGISDSGVNLTQKRFLEMKIPVPPIEIQRETELEVLRRLSVIEVAGREIEHGLRRAARLRQAILKQAFEGKLVPQDPTDESANELLARLIESRSIQGAASGDTQNSQPSRRAGAKASAKRRIVK